MLIVDKWKSNPPFFSTIAGYTYNIANVVALCAAFGSISLWTHSAYSLDGKRLVFLVVIQPSRYLDMIIIFYTLLKFMNFVIDAVDFLMLEDNHQSGLFGGSYSEENVRSVMNIIRKLLVPIFLCLTVWLNWGQPVNIAVKVILIILSTKPFPSSVHLFVEQVLPFLN